MQVFDTSSIIHAWDNYPIGQFPSMWRWMAQQLDSGGIQLPSVAIVEVSNMAQDCYQWLRENGLRSIDMSNQILTEALRLKNLLGIVGDRYGGGVDENDLFIIASTYCHGVRLVSNENAQPTLPGKKIYNYKIPAVCGMRGVRVDCVNFVEFLRTSGAVF
ncbi:MAG: putative nucleic acid-binding protein contains domain [Herminiimonas sp.]|nr:putative nucleic acid-binding protein contains domain [Herminiimonas sp.]